MRLVFMGTPDFAATILEGLINSGHEIIAVVTQPDKKKGRGQEISCSPVKELAARHGLTIYQPVKVKEPVFLDLMRELKPDAIIVAAFGQILPKALLEIPEQGCINVHASLLPKYRGAAPIQYAILDGEKETGITIMYMDTGIDTGDIILQESLAIEPDETGGSLFDKMAALGAKLLLVALDQIENGTATRTGQDHEQASCVKMMTKEMGLLDFSLPAIRLERMIRGLNPWPSAYTFLDGKSLKVWKAEVEEAKEKDTDRHKPGEIIEIRKDAIVVNTAEGRLVIKELQLEGKKRMTADAFLRGCQLAVGTVFG